MGGGSGSSGKKSYSVNVDGSKKAVKLAESSRDKGIDILVELDSQSERLDRIEGTVDNIHANLDRGDRHLRFCFCFVLFFFLFLLCCSCLIPLAMFLILFFRGIASAGGACRNLVTRNKTARHNPKVMMREQIAQQRWAEDFKVLIPFFSFLFNFCSLSTLIVCPLGNFIEASR